MTIQITPEVAAARKNLEKLCGKFENSINELCAQSPQVICPNEFYEHESVSIAAECVEALSKLQSASSHEGTAYERAVTKADEAFSRQKSELEEDAQEMALSHDQEVAAVEREFSQQRNQLEKDKYTQISGLDRKSDWIDKDAYFRWAKIGIIPSIILYWILGGASGFHDSGWDVFLVGIFFGLFIPYIVAGVCYLLKKSAIVESERRFTVASKAIEDETDNLIANASAARDKKIKELGAKRDKENAEAMAVYDEAVANASANRTQAINTACSKKDQAMAYIAKEYQVFDTRLCQDLDKLQSFVDTWTEKNVRVTSILDENWVQKFSENSERIASSRTRVGNINFWNSIEKSSEVEIAHTKMQALSETEVYIRDVLVPVLLKISAKMFSKRTDDTQIPVIKPKDSAKMSLKEAKEADDTQIPVIKPENSEDFDNYLRDIFNDWCAKGDIEFNLLSAFHSILRIAGYEDPKQTIQSWIMSVKELAANALEMPISEFGFLDLDLSIELDQLGVEESFFLFYAYSRNEVDQRKNIKYTVATRLALNALVGEKQQQQMVEAFNKILESE